MTGIRTWHGMEKHINGKMKINGTNHVHRIPRRRGHEKGDRIMDLKLYGICFQLRGNLDLLSFVQSNTPIPVEVTQQVMDQMDSITQSELDFADKMQKNWKKAFNEKVPLIMKVTPDSGYEITCSIPNEMLKTVRILTGLEDSKIVEEYAADHLKNVCGIDTSIISVDVETTEDVSVKTERAQGFDLNDLGAEPDGPVFEDVASFGGVEEMLDEEPASVMETAVEDSPIIMEEPPFVDTVPEETMVDETYVDGETDYEEDVIPYDGPVMEEPFVEEVPEEAVPEETLEETVPKEAADGVKSAIAGIYSELVTNIKDKKLDDRLGIKIGK